MNLPEREESSHKGENGEIAVIAGSRDYTGAPTLASKAALRAGGDLVRTLTSETVRDIVASHSPNLIVRSYPGGYLGLSGVEIALDLIEESDVALVGPGMSQPDTEALKEIFERREMRWVVDADAIKPALEAEVENSVFTPHRAEIKHIEEKYGSAQNFVEDTGNIVVQKSKTDKIYSGSGLNENKTGTSAMTVGGTGDVLAGVIASLIAQGLEPEKAAFTGALVNGKAGELATERFGNGMLATDLLERIPDAFENL